MTRCISVPTTQEGMNTIVINGDLYVRAITPEDLEPLGYTPEEASFIITEGYLNNEVERAVERVIQNDMLKDDSYVVADLEGIMRG